MEAVRGPALDTLQDGSLIVGTADARRAPRIGTVASTVAILRLLAKERRPLGVSAIARSLSLTPSSCFNILKTLVTEGFVDFDLASKLYSLGDGVIAIARGALDPLNAFEIIRGRVERLADAWSITVGLWHVRNDRIILIGYSVARNTMEIHLTVGQRLPLLMGAVGRCVAAVRAIPDKEVGKQFKALRWDQSPTLETYVAEVREVKARGWAIDRGHFVRGATTVAVPISPAHGELSYCLSATSFTGKLSEEKLPVLASEMQSLSRWAGDRLLAR